MTAPKKKEAPKKAAPKQDAAPNETSVKLVPDTSVVPLKPGDVKLQPMIYQRWTAFVPPHYTREHLESDRLWAFMAAKFTDMDRVEIVAEDGSWLCELFIRRNIGRSLKVQLIPDSWKKLTEASMVKDIEIGGYAIRWAGAARRFIATNVATKDVLKENMNTQMEAIQYVTDHLKAAR